VTKRRISPEEFISRVNAELPKMPGDVSGMRVFLYPDGCTLHMRLVTTFIPSPR